MHTQFLDLSGILGGPNYRNYANVDLIVDIARRTGVQVRSLFLSPSLYLYVSLFLLLLLLLLPASFSFPISQRGPAGLCI